MKTTLITGASGGIGEAFARRLAAQNHNLFLVARSGEKLQALCGELEIKHKINTQFFALDLTEPDADARLFARTSALDLEIEWLINNAGFGVYGDFATHDLAEELAMIDLNVRVLTALAHRYLQPMRARRSGAIINVASTAAFQPVPYMATYAATKSFVNSFSQALADENREFGVKILALCPGATETGFFERAGSVGKIPRHGFQSAETVVETALRALEAGKSSVISGWNNRLIAHLANLAPDSLVARAIGNSLRKKADKAAL